MQLQPNVAPQPSRSADHTPVTLFTVDRPETGEIPPVVIPMELGAVATFLANLEYQAEDARSDEVAAADAYQLRHIRTVAVGKLAEYLPDTNEDGSPNQQKLADIAAYNEVKDEYKRQTEVSSTFWSTYLDQHPDHAREAFHLARIQQATQDQKKMFESLDDDKEDDDKDSNVDPRTGKRVKKASKGSNSHKASVANPLNWHKFSGDTSENRNN